ncbi:hypothetical protein P872_04125 [Rhodonellum psychrophilum GCM71 = DSM 17998]|uniref:Tat (Twin-arginine translocation) pathway signal sequence containing protein n=2 Tax=Rhodonellum TaxID=336827 RepID=U5C1A3_9BACT|nr:MULTISPECIES: ferritin-like domain-containing protein [Rhodonellum]ERM82711.1 hypothetical protein P872_04125 [Rhodonellum psychrophilum GCM71 = DSM 17998]MDO9554434.1 ferritin-like domain-containing protein [Rhodonellum sp.]SDZ29141.1 Tat (twin-arginine translocation) pathway signal sequence [Rhodonellum ikkaensis]
MSKTNQVKEDTKSVFQNKGSRRNFLKYSGAGIATAGILLMGCEDNENMVPDLDGVVNLGSGDVGVLNYAYVLEQLEAAFYINVVTNLYRNISDVERTMMEDLRNHEVAHRDFLKAALGSNAIGELTFDFSSVNFNNRESVLATAKVFEDLGVAAYNGAGKLLQNPDFLLIAGKIVSVEARHAAAIRSILDSDPKSFAGNDVIDANGLDRAFEPAMVLNAASTFILNKINASQLPTS